ncbi:ASCH domain-containing protein [Vibrio cholerae]
MSDIILSIKPEFTKLILLGKKTIELRKRVGKQFSPGCDLYIYASSPQKAIVGKAIISSIDYADIDVIIKRYLTQTCVEESFIRGYYKNHRKGVLVSICNVVKFSSPLALSELRTFGFHPPQSFCYVSEDLSPILRNAI